MSDSLLMDQRRRWEQGDRILVEAYVEKRPGLRGQAEEVLELIEHEILLRQERQETPSARRVSPPLSGPGGRSAASFRGPRRPASRSPSGADFP